MIKINFIDHFFFLKFKDKYLLFKFFFCSKKCVCLVFYCNLLSYPFTILMSTKKSKSILIYRDNIAFLGLDIRLVRDCKKKTLYNLYFDFFFSKFLILFYCSFTLLNCLKKNSSLKEKSDTPDFTVLFFFEN